MIENKLSNIIKTNVKFTKSTNVIDDFENEAFLESFVCSHNLEKIIDRMFRALLDSHAKQGAFTITGPYGTGKSSLILFLSALLSKNTKLHAIAKSKLKLISKDLPILSQGRKGFFVLPVIGDLVNPETLILTELTKQKEFLLSIGISLDKLISEKKSTIQILKEISDSDKIDGVLFFIDEMGKCLEGIIYQKTADIHFFQTLAELANYSNGKLIFIGVLHQFFSGYSRNLPHNMRDEWAKTQGRFQDIPFSTVSEEQLELIGKSIEYIDKKFKPNLMIAMDETIHILSLNKDILDKDHLKKILQRCWPLHPIVSILLTHISKKSFGQNQRSIFSFLNSAEINGFKYFLQNQEVSKSKVYMPHDFFDYLDINLSSYISMSSDSKLWNLATNAIEKCKAQLNQESRLHDQSFSNDQKVLYINLTKTIALIDLLSNISGLFATSNLLIALFEKQVSKSDVSSALNNLLNWKTINFKYYHEAYVISEASDFDLDTAYKKYANHFNGLTSDTILNKLSEHFEFPPMVAKRHYHTHGSMRWMNMVLAPVEDFESFLTQLYSKKNTVGFWAILFTRSAEDKKIANDLLTQAHSFKFPVFITMIDDALILNGIINEFFILEKILEEENIKLKDDSIAKSEIEARKSILFSMLENELNQLSLKVNWFYDKKDLGILNTKLINEKISEVCDQIFHQTPKIKSEILNRSKLSPTANGMVKKLLKEMLLNAQTLNLGLKEGSPEYNLYQIFLVNTGIHKNDEAEKKGSYQYPSNQSELHSLWGFTTKFLRETNRKVSLSEIFNQWAQPPFGVKNGLNSLLVISYILTNINHLSVYDEQGYIFDLAENEAIFIDEMLKNPQMISLKTVTGALHEENFLDQVFQMTNQLIETYRSEISPSIKGLEKNEFSELKIAAKLVSLVKTLPTWVLKIQSSEWLDPLDIKIRDSIKYAKDPSEFFSDLVNIFKQHHKQDDSDLNPFLEYLEQFFSKILTIYPNLMKTIINSLIHELDIEMLNLSEANWQGLRDRAINVMKYRLESDFIEKGFLQTLSEFKGTYSNVKSLISILTGKYDNWIDDDIYKFKAQLSKFCENFKKNEVLAGNRRGLHIMHIGESSYQEISINYLKDNPIVNHLKKELTTSFYNSIIQKNTSQSNTQDELFLSVIMGIACELLDKNTKK